TSVPRSNPQDEAARLAELLPRMARPTGLPGRGSVRLRIHDDGVFSSTSGEAARRLEDAIGRWLNLSVSRRGATVEIWLLRRTDEQAVVLATKLTTGGGRAERGALRPDVCACLAR